MKSLYRSLAITAGAVLTLAAVFAALLLQPPQRPSGGQMAGGAVFTAAEPVELSSVAVHNATGAYRFFYEGDGYVLDDIPATIADLGAFIDFMVNAGRLSALRQVADAPAAAYGLDAPAATVAIDFFHGGAMQLAIGGREALSGGYYVAAEGFPGVYLMAAPMAEPFLRPKTQVIDKNVTPPLMVTSPLSAVRDVTFAGGPLERPVTIQAVSGGDEQVRLAALSFGSATHLVRETGVHQLDQTYGIEILGSLFGIQALGVEAYNLSEGEIAALGFADPWMTVTFDAVNGANAQVERHVLLVRREDGAYFATLEGSGAVFRIGRQPFMDIEYARLPVRWFLTPLLMDLSAVTVEGDGRKYRFEIDNADPRNPVITRDGAVLDTRLFRSFFRLITSAAHDGTYLGALERPAGGAMLSITYEYTAPGKEPDVLALYPGEARRALVFVNGAGEFAMKDQFAARVLEGCESLLAGRPIEENW